MSTNMSGKPDRRSIVHTFSAAGLVLTGGVFVPASANAAEGGDEVTPPEDLMREHGVLDRALLIYEAVMHRFSDREEVDPALITDTAHVIRELIEDYHERSEENYVFPRFKAAGQLVDLVDVLLAQHQAGRRVTATILRLAPQSRSDGAERRELIGAMASFIRMYRPHAAREDTVLFPKLKDVVSPHEYDAMAEDFEQEEHKKFGQDGFEKMVARVAELERRIGIHDLAKFTPQ
jgi:hemerythrin-like domain-containing protein